MTPPPGPPVQKPAVVTPPPGPAIQKPANATPPPGLGAGPETGGWIAARAVPPVQKPANLTPPPGPPVQKPANRDTAAPARCATPAGANSAAAPLSTGLPGRRSCGRQCSARPRQAGPRRASINCVANDAETREGNATVIQEADRTIIREGGHDIIRHNEADRFRMNAREVNVEQRGNDTVTIALRPDGSRIITEVDANGRLIRRIRRDPQGREVIIIDNSFEPRGPGYAGYFVDLPPPAIRIPRELYVRELDRASAEDVFLTLAAPPVERIDRRYTLDEIRYSEPLRARMPRVDIDTVNFDTGSWEIAPDQVQRLAFVAQGILRAVQRNPREVFMIEGYTDAVGNDVDNLSLSDRRAESVAVVLTDRFGVPPENLTTQGYGKQFLKVPTDGPERANRRVAVQRITPLLMGQN